MVPAAGRTYVPRPFILHFGESPRSLLRGRGNMRIALALCGMLSLTVTLSAADFTGTWVLNPAKSTAPNIVSQTMKIEQTGANTTKDIIDVVLKSGQKVHQEINRIYD